MQIFNLMEQRLILRITPAQCVETDTAMYKIDLATHQAMRPIFVDWVVPGWQDKCVQHKWKVHIGA